MRYSNGLKKAVTFSYDDGIGQDRRLVEMFNRYGLKATFNVGSGMLDEEGHWETEGVIVKRLASKEISSIFVGHEVACHGLTHPHIPSVSSEEKRRQIVEDKLALDQLLPYSVEGMSYPFGGVDDEMIEIMKECGLWYGRVVPSSHSFTLPTDLYRLQPTVHHNDERIFELIEAYLALDSEDATMLYIWGHSYEFDVDSNWDRMENICQMLSGKEDIWYCTNIELIKDIY